MNEEKFVLARVKRILTTIMFESDERTNKDIKVADVLRIIAEEEAAAILGSEELADEWSDFYLKINEKGEK